MIESSWLVLDELVGVAMVQSAAEDEEERCSSLDSLSLLLSSFLSTPLCVG